MSVDELLRRNGKLATLDEETLTVLRSKMPEDVYLKTRLTYEMMQRQRAIR